MDIKREDIGKCVMCHEQSAIKRLWAGTWLGEDGEKPALALQCKRCGATFANYRANILALKLVIET
jgi:hypothetical protein